MTVFLILLLCLAAFAFISIVIWTLRNGISPMPTSPVVKRVLLSNLPDVEKGKVVEIGAGWGGLAFSLAKTLPRCEVVGYENSPVPYYFSLVHHLLHPMKNLKFFHSDFFEVSLEDADLVVCYLFPEAMRKLKGKFERELKEGTWVVSNTFAIPGWKPIDTLDVNDLYNTKVYVYRIIPKHYRL